MDTLRAKQAWENMCRAEHVLIVSDVHVDGDTVGSSLGLFHELTARSVHVTHLSPLPVPEAFSFLPGYEHINVDGKTFSDPTVDLLISFDCSDGSHVLAIRDRLPKKPPVISFDHHATNIGYGDTNFVYTKASSTAEVVYTFLQTVGAHPSREAATCLLTGLCTDTSLFYNPATNAQALAAASDLSLRGGRVQDVIKFLFTNRSTNELRLWGRALERLSVHPDHGFATTYLTEADLAETGVQPDDLGGIISNFLIALLNLDTVMVFRESENGGVKASLRTISGDVAKVASWFPGGGGHVKAAGFYVPNARICPSPDGSCRIVAAT